MYPLVPAALCFGLGGQTRLSAVLVWLQYLIDVRPVDIGVLLCPRAYFLLRTLAFPSALAEALGDATRSPETSSVVIPMS